MYLGRYQIGQCVGLYLRCAGPSKVPTAPTIAPLARIFNGTTLVQAIQLPPCDRFIPNCSGQFHLPLFLGPLYSAGQYQVVYYYTIGSTSYVDEAGFEVMPNGDNRGAVVSAYFLERPEASYVVQGLENGSIIKGRNPTV